MAPLPASATDAVFPVELAHTLAGALIDTVKAALIGTLLESVPLHPLLLTVTSKLTDPLAPALKVMLAVPLPPVIVPPPMVQL